LAGAWLDLARVDSLFLGLQLAALFCVRGTGSWRRAVAAGVLMGAAFLTKQEALLPCLAVLPFLWRRGPKIATSYLVSVAAVVAIPTIVLQHASKGWYLQYTLWLPMQHDVAGEKLLGFWTHDIARAVGIAVVIGGAALMTLRSDRRSFYVPVVLALVLASYGARLHTGGYDNVLLPAYAGIAVAFGIGCHVLTRSPKRTRLVLIAAVAQFALLVYNPLSQIPTSADARAGDRFLADLRPLPRPIYLPGHSWLLERLGEPPTAHAGALGDILRGNARGSDHRLDRDLRRLIAQQRYGAIVVDSPRRYSQLPHTLARYYCVGQRIPRLDFPRPHTGTQVLPATVWVRRSAGAAASTHDC
jgi:hypothetical protein